MGLNITGTESNGEFNGEFSFQCHDCFRLPYKANGFIIATLIHGKAYCRCSIHKMNKNHILKTKNIIKSVIPDIKVVQSLRGFDTDKFVLPPVK